MDNSTMLNEMIEKNRADIIKLGRELFSCPELGFKEVKSNEILTSFLFQNEIPYRTGFCRTGIKATIGSGTGPHIALVADMDALEIRDGGRKKVVHSCGHSIQTAVMAYVLKMINESGILKSTGGRVSFIAAPAEEFIDFDFRQELVKNGEIKYYSGKQNMISAGIFDDIDCVISMHVNGDSGSQFDIDSTLSGFTVKRAVFLGTPAHSGAAPHLGRNALHGASLCMNAISYMKEQFPREAGIQIHPVVSYCTGSVNIIPDEAVLDSYVRANNLQDLMEAGIKFDNCARHSAEALGLTCRIENKIGYMPLEQSDKVNSVIYRHMLELSDDEKILKNVISGASGDVGDLSYLLPTVQFGFSGVRGRIHSGEFEVADEENVYINTAKIVLGTIADILPDLSFITDRDEYLKRKAYYLKNWLLEE